MHRLPRVMRCAFDGLVIGAIAGLAFQVFEDVAYVYGSAASNFGQAQYGTPTLGMRTVLGLTGHWAWDSIVGLTGGATWAIGLYVPLTIVDLVVFIWVYRKTVAKEREWARALLADEVDRGVITAGELEAAVARRKDRKHFVKSQPNHCSTKHVLEATGDLADEIAEGYGVDTPGVEQARAEIARLRG